MNLLSAVGKEPGGRLGAPERGEMTNERRWESRGGGQMQKDKPWERRRDTPPLAMGWRGQRR